MTNTMKTKMTDSNFSRRQFIKTTGAAAIATPLIIPSSALLGNGLAPSDRINLGIIGCGWFGKGESERLYRSTECGGYRCL